MFQTKKNNKNKKKKFTLEMFNKILFILIIIFGVYYLSGVNDLSIKSFKLQELKKRTDYLNNENNNSEFKIMSLGSYSSLIQKAEELNMVAAGEIDYITGGTAVVAVQK